MPCTIFVVAITAPVLPAETTPWAAPSRTSRDCYPNGAVLLSPHGLASRVLHGDHFAGVMDLDRKPSPLGMAVEFLRDDLLLAYQNHLYIVRFSG